MGYWENDSEGFSLENILNGVGTILYGVEGGDAWKNSPVKDDKGGFSNLYNRNLFHE